MKKRSGWVAVIAVLASASFARAGIIVDQQPAQLGGYGSDTDFLDFFGNPVWYLEADNIRLAQSATARNLRFYGFYGGDEQIHEPPQGNEMIRVRFYAARPSDGLPDNAQVLFEQSFLNLARTETGKTIAVDGRPVEYLFEADLGAGISLLANTTYWLEVAQIGDRDSTFRWETGFGAVSGHAVINYNIPDWVSSTGSFAFTLSTIPEPSTLAFFLFSGLCITRAWRRKRRMPGDKEQRLFGAKQ